MQTQLLTELSTPRMDFWNGEYDPIVPLQLTGNKTPLFCVHPSTGDVLSFINLAKFFVNDRPFYALRARGLEEPEECFSTFDEMVFAYADAIRRCQPRGPYAIAGYSYGGPVAFEIVKVLESRGERVAFLGSIDMPPNLLYLHDSISTEGRQDLNADIASLRRRVQVAESLLAIGKSHRPSGRVESVTVFCGDSMRGTKDDWLKSQFERWDDFTRASNRYIEVAGGHYALMGIDHLQDFQAILRDEIERAFSGS